MRIGPPGALQREVRRLLRKACSHGPSREAPAGRFAGRYRRIPLEGEQRIDFRAIKARISMWDIHTYYQHHDRTF
jgi:hypothetical protein